MQQNIESLVGHILDLSNRIYGVLEPAMPVDFLPPDLTVAQLRVLLLLHTEGPCKMSDIAAVLGVTLPTTTGIMDNLVKKDMVVREAAPQDRRLVICRLSQNGQELINGLWTSGQFQMEKLLDGLTVSQLKKVKEVAEILFKNVSRSSPDNTSIKRQE